MTAMACVHYAGSASQARNVPVPVEIRMGAVLECGAFVDGRDVAAAVGRALTVPLAGHHRALLCGPGIAGTAPSLELAARLAPHVPVTGPAAIAPIPGPPSSTAQPPPPHSAANPPTTGHSTAQTPAPSHNNPRGKRVRLPQRRESVVDFRHQR
jgi:hypothetical protein